MFYCLSICIYVIFISYLTFNMLYVLLYSIYFGLTNKNLSSIALGGLYRTFATCQLIYQRYQALSMILSHVIYRYMLHK